MELKEAENIVRSSLMPHNPSSHALEQDLISTQLSCSPKPDETFEFPGGIVAIEYERDFPSQCIQKYWWLLNHTDYLKSGKKLAMVSITINRDAERQEQTERLGALGRELEKKFPAFSFYHIAYADATPDAISAALAKAYEAVKA
ncbi:MAG: hypothetical protein ACOX8V_00850 [Thermoleophilia bacterium]